MAKRLRPAQTTRRDWTREQLVLAFSLYCQLSFGRLHSRNPEIVELASRIDRTPSALAMKLVNFASLDPSITSTGRVGLKGASAQDRRIWDEFHSDWERLALEAEAIRQRLGGAAPHPDVAEPEEVFAPEDFTGETRQVLTQQRVKQSFFRRAVLSSYKGCCCMSGISNPLLLVASHIVPWGVDKANRLNPSNGLCLSALHDRAFDKGLITLSDELSVVLSEKIKHSSDDLIRHAFLPLQHKRIDLPERFHPASAFIAYHRTKVFVDAERSPPLAM